MIAHSFTEVLLLDAEGSYVNAGRAPECGAEVTHESHVDRSDRRDTPLGEGRVRPGGNGSVT